MTRIVIACLALVALAACGGKSGTLTINIVTSPGDDPFSDAASVRFTVGTDSSHVTTVPVTGGHFSYKVSFKPNDMPGPVLIEALAGDGATVVAHGQTPYLLLSAVDQGPIAAWVGRPGRVAPADAMLPKAIAETASTYVPGLGILYCGGRDASGTPLPDTEVYDVFTHAIISTAPMDKARAAAISAQVSDVHAVVYGGATMGGFGTAPAVDGELQLFDPTVGVGVWAALGVDTFPARAYATKTILASGAILVSGGVDASGNVLASAGLIPNTGTILLATTSGPMAAARVGHAGAAAKFPEGDGALLFGGLPAGTTGAPVAERIVGQSFSAYDVGAQPNRNHATATTMPNGDVLILGGTTATGVESSGLVITPTVPATVTPLPGALSVARSGHSASLTGNDLVVCGGTDGSGTVQGTCDVLDATTYGRKSTIPLGTPRTGQSSETMETGVVVLAGGFGADGAPLASMEIYTP